MNKCVWMMLTIITIVVIPIAAMADAGWYPGHYGPAPTSQLDIKGKHPTVAMASEEVVITLHADRVEVKGTFYFENTGGPEEVEMFFPLDYDPYLDKEVIDGTLMQKSMPSDGKASAEGFYRVSAKELSTDFAVTVDSVKVECVFEKDYEFDEHINNFPAMAVWSVAFKAGTKRCVVCTYTDTYGRVGGEIGPRVNYALFTGATWRGPIGFGKITVRPGDDFDWSVPLFYKGEGVPPAHDEGNSIVWEFKELEPVVGSWGAVDGELEKYVPNAAIQVRFAKRSTMETGVEEGRGYMPGLEGPGAPAKILTNYINFRSAPNPDAPKAAGKETLMKDEYVNLFERQGDWYRVKTVDRYEGWVRWHYVDPVSGGESIYVWMVENVDE